MRDPILVNAIPTVDVDAGIGKYTEQKILQLR